MKVLFNNNISQVNVYEKSRHYCDLSFKKGKKQIGTKWGIFTVYEEVEGLFFWWGDGYWGTVEEYNRDRETYFEDGEFYKKPHCIIHTNSGKENIVYFKTTEELHKYVDELKNLAPHIIIK